MPDQYAVPTLILAGIAAVGTLVSIAVVLVIRYRDRVELRVHSVTLRDNTVFVHVRNRVGRQPVSWESSSRAAAPGSTSM
jgi:hypothetical protein